MPESAIFSVSDVTFYIKDLLESNATLLRLEVEGEVSNLTYHGSGHVYFTLKDAQAQLSCAMFRQYALRAPRLQNGDKIVANGSISVYAPQGRYQLLATAVRPAGAGDLFQQFQLLKEQLAREGLFDAARKRSLPAFPRRIAIVTSPTGAALRDVLRALRRRFPAVQAIVVPAVVQGAEGATSIVQALAAAAGLSPDLILLVRGGGSIEDLWNFNEAPVVRAVAACPCPVVTGIGHETDFTLADFAADLRASTPTAAAELSVPDAAALRQQQHQWLRQMRNAFQSGIDFRRQLLDDYQERSSVLLQRNAAQYRRELLQLRSQMDLRAILRHKRQVLQDMRAQLDTGIRQALQARREAAVMAGKSLQISRLFSFQHQLLDDYGSRLDAAMLRSIERRRQELKLLQARLDGADLSQTLARGFTLTLKDGKALRQGAGLQAGDSIETVFADIRVSSTVDPA